MKKLGRVITAMVTPFDDKGQVSYDQAKKLALTLINCGSDGLVVSGTTGESPVLNKEEKLRLFSEVKKAIGNKGTVIANTGNYCTSESVELTKEAVHTGVDAVMAVVPYYNKPTQEGLYQHFSAIANSTDLPMLVYNVPGRTATNINADTVIRLSKIKNIVGLKEASGNLAQAATVIQETSNDFMVYSGNDGDTLSMMAVGGYGVISVASHIVGVQIKNMVTYYLAGKVN
ncbi:MAG: 4-hydroxy-tetrahydrodipicolinate synthase, partial [Chloroflexi bacterium]|nr:4-hydroxy-tetrahydrodipicolinate synthase [Chloroflexota bacterium]